jgi:hypothetical protein
LTVTFSDKETATMTNSKKIYRDAALLAAIQLDRPFSAQDIARIEACIEQAAIAQEPSRSSGYENLSLLVGNIPNLSTETYKPLAPLSGIEEALDEVGKKIARNFAPMPKVESEPQT